MIRKDTLKIRYQVYRRLGYDSRTSRALSQRSLDVSGLELSKKTGKLKQNTTTKTYINETMEQWKRRDAINKHIDRMNDVKNDTVYTRHGMLVRDKRYKGETGKIVSIIKHENKLSTNQAYYFYYFMSQQRLKTNFTYEQAKKQLLSNKEFEEYDKRKRSKVI
jgi:hypothetical protein